MKGQPRKEVWTKPTAKCLTVSVITYLQHGAGKKQQKKNPHLCACPCFSFLPFLCHIAQSLERVKGGQMGRGGRGLRGGRKGNLTVQSLWCGILGKERDTTHFQYKDQAAASIYSTASAVFSSLDTIPEIISQTPAVNRVTKCIPHKSTSLCKWPVFLLCI